MTLDIPLNKSQTLALNALLSAALGSVDIKDLHEQPHEYVIAACLFDVRRKIAPKAEELQLFGGDSFTLKLSRAEALAFDVWFNPHDWDTESEQVVKINDSIVLPKTYEYGLLIHICNLIGQKYYT